jgi:hypothetical protein
MLFEKGSIFGSNSLSKHTFIFYVYSNTTSAVTIVVGNNIVSCYRLLGVQPLIDVDGYLPYNADLEFDQRTRTLVPRASYRIIVHTLCIDTSRERA